MNLLERTLLVTLLMTAIQLPGQVREIQAETKLGASSPTDGASAEIQKVITGSYKALELEKSEAVLSFYHPNSNIISTKEELDRFFSQMDVSYLISDFRYIGRDGENHIVIFREVTEFRRQGKADVAEKVDTDVLMVFRKLGENYRIFTSRSLMPAP